MPSVEHGDGTFGAGAPAERGRVALRSMFKSRPVVWLKRKWQVASAIIRQHPSTLAVPLTMLCIMLAVGLWGTIWGANRYAEQQKQQARGFADAYLANYQRKVQEVLTAMSMLAVQIRQNPSSWAVLSASLASSSGDILNLIHLNRTSKTETIFVAPQARMLMKFTDVPLEQGADYMSSGTRRTTTLTCIRSRGPLLIGPFAINGTSMSPDQPATIVSVLAPVFVSAPSTVAWLPSDLPQATNCTGDCAMNEDGEVFWGIVGASKRIENFISSQAFSKAGYSYLITAPSRNQKPEDTAVTSTDKTYMPLVVARSVKGVNDPVMANVSMDASAAQWTLQISPDSGTWQPDWRGPMIAVVVVVSVALATMQFIALLAWRQHSMLLVSLLPENVLKRLQSEHDFGASPSMSAGMTGTPAETMLHLLSCMMQDEPPDLRDVVVVRTTLMRGADVYQPLDLTAKIKAASGLHSDVARALALALDNTYSTAADMPSANVSRCNTSAFPDIPRSPNAAQFTSLRDALAHIAFDQDTAHSKGAEIMGSSPNEDVPDGTLEELLRSSPALQSSSSQQPNLLAALTAPPSAAVDGDVPVFPTDIDAAGKHGKDSAGVMQLTKQPKLDKLERQLVVSSEWAFDAMALAAASNGRPLSTLGFYLISTTGLMNTFKLKGAVLARFLTRVESLYIVNPYHSATHAADVLQSMHVLLQRGGIAAMCTEPLGQLACYMAAVVHDLGHLGRTNDFLCATSHDLAVRYNDKAPLENHHVSQAFEILRDPDLNFLAPLTRQQYATLRRTVIELVLSTDMKQHFSVVSQFKTLHSGTISAAQDCVRASSSRGQHRFTPNGQGNVRRPPSEKGGHEKDTAFAQTSLPPSSPQLDDAGKLLTLQFTLKCADLGHLSSPLPVHLRWVAALEEEYFRQGDAEKEASLPVSPLFDRSKPGITKSQVGFFNFVVLPQFHTLAAALPAMQPLRDAVDANYRYWQEHERKEKEKEELTEQH